MAAKLSRTRRRTRLCFPRTRTRHETRLKKFVEDEDEDETLLPEDEDEAEALDLRLEEVLEASNLFRGPITGR